MSTSWIPADSICRPVGAVLVWNGEDCLVAARVDGVWYEIATGRRIPEGIVTHWLPLPDPP